MLLGRETTTNQQTSSFQDSKTPNEHKQNWLGMVEQGPILPPIPTTKFLAIRAAQFLQLSTTLAYTIELITANTLICHNLLIYPTLVPTEPPIHTIMQRAKR